jgi:hypothetical protein
MASQANSGVTTSNANRNKEALAPVAFHMQFQKTIAVGCMTYVHALDQIRLQQVHQKFVRAAMAILKLAFCLWFKISFRVFIVLVPFGINLMVKMAPASL